MASLTYTAQQILNSVFTGAALRVVTTSGATAPATPGDGKSVTRSEQEIFNAIFDPTNNKITTA